MEKLKAEGYLTRWNSATLKSRPVAQGELKRLLKTEKNLDEVCRERKKEKKKSRRGVQKGLDASARALARFPRRTNYIFC
jgi:ribosome assembly protein YihI (activator of Der GTPase)